ncbi:MAG: hypothetical protein MI747_05750, partial [Desulfobacterales bacterium]|nr:hypothetical protein [Desulfobacterales bacterium]
MAKWPAREVVSLAYPIQDYFIDPAGRVAVAVCNAHGKTLGIQAKVPLLKPEGMSPRGRFGVSMNVLYDLERGRRLKGLGWGWLRVFSPDESHLLYDCPGAPVLLDLGTLETRYLDPYLGEYKHFAFSPGARYLAGWEYYSSKNPRTFQLRTLADDHVVGEIKTHPHGMDFYFLPNGESFLCRGVSGALEWWNCNPLALKKRFPDRVVRFRLGVDGSMVAFETPNGRFFLMALADGKKQEIKTHGWMPVSTCFFSRSGRYFCVASLGKPIEKKSGKLAVFRTDTGERLLEQDLCVGASACPPRPLAGDQVALVCGNSLLIYDLSCLDLGAAQQAVDGLELTGRSGLDAIYSVYEFYRNTPAGRGLEPLILDRVSATHTLAAYLEAEEKLRDCRLPWVQDRLRMKIKEMANPVGYAWFMETYPGHGLGTLEDGKAGDDAAGNKSPGTQTRTNPALENKDRFMAEYLDLLTTAALEENTIAACTDLLL